MPNNARCSLNDALEAILLPKIKGVTVPSHGHVTLSVTTHGGKITRIEVVVGEATLA